MSSAARPVVVMKFGGTVTGSPWRMQALVKMVAEAVETVRPVLVVSALSGVTRQLDRGLQAVVAARRNGGAPHETIDALIEDLRTRHMEQAEELLDMAALSTYQTALNERLADLQSVLQTVAQTGFTPAHRDAVLATGEQCSVPMVVAALQVRGMRAEAGDATTLIRTDDTYGEANVDLALSHKQVARWFADLADEAIPVVAGFIGRDGGTVTTLGFEGSDYTAALMASFTNAASLTRFTDVEGIYTADPNTDAAAQRIDQLTMEQAFAWTESGRLGMHPKTLRPLAEANIPMQVRCIDRPHAPGTQICPASVMDPVFWPPIAG